MTDYADIILSAIILALALALFIQILFVTTKLDDEEKLRNIRIIAGEIFFVILFLFFVFSY